MSMYLYDHQNIHAPTRSNGLKFWGYPSRRKNVALIVIHTAESLPDIQGIDMGAENVARFGSTMTRPASWHVVVDSDTTVDCLPDEATAFHVRGYNSRALGIELATRAHDWRTLPAGWRDAILYRAAEVVSRWCKTHTIPPIRITKEQADQGERGIIAHADLDSRRRTDPGKDFPWIEFLDLVVSISEGTRPDYDPPLALERIVSVLAAPSGGFWQLGENGGVYAWLGGEYHGSASGKDYWGDRRAAQLRANGDGYTIIATSGEEYDYGPS